MMCMNMNDTYTNTMHELINTNPFLTRNPEPRNQNLKSPNFGVQIMGVPIVIARSPNLTPIAYKLQPKRPQIR